MCASGSFKVCWDETSVHPVKGGGGGKCRLVVRALLFVTRDKGLPEEFMTCLTAAG